MTLRAVTPLPLPDLVDLFCGNVTYFKPGRILHRAMILQGARSESIGWYAGGELIAGITLYPLDPEIAGEDLRELSFACRPAAARHLTGILHTARLTRARLAEYPGLRIRATVAKGHEPGRRLARLTGLRLAREAGAFELWEWTSEGFANGSCCSGNFDGPG